MNRLGPATGRERLAIRRWLILSCLVALGCPTSDDDSADGDDDTAAVQGPWKTVSAGMYHTCATDHDDHVYCWGDDTFGQSWVPDLLGDAYPTINAGDNHNCALSPDGVVACWGDNQSGQLMVPPGDYRQVEGGGFHTCGVVEGGDGVCWGDDYWGQLDVPDGVEFATIGSGRTHSCGIDVDGGLHCWGDNSRSQLDHPNIESQHLSVGSTHNCAIDEFGTTWCWGTYGELDTTPPDEEFISVSQYYHLCGITADQRIVCWGEVKPEDCLESPEGEFRSLSVGFQHACAITTDDEMVCWGKNIKGQLDVPEIG